MVANGESHDRVMRALATFERRLITTVAKPTAENRDQLRAAAERLMRSVAGVLIDIERGNYNGDQ